MASSSRRSARIAAIETAEAQRSAERACDDPFDPRYVETAYKGGKQCTHAPNFIYKDLRESAPPRRPTYDILRGLLYNFSNMSDLDRAILATHVAPDGSDGRAAIGGGSDGVPGPSFPQFGRLPAELRTLIWQLAVPRRIIDWPEFERPDYGDTGERIAVPVVASVCREARNAVFRLGGGSTVAFVRDSARKPSPGEMSPAGDAGKAAERHLAGYIMPRDFVFHSRGPRVHEYGTSVYESWEDADGVVVCKEFGLRPRMRGDAVCVYWSDPMRDLKPYNFTKDIFYEERVRKWEFLGRMEGLRHLFIIFRYPVHVTVRVSEEFRDLTGDDDKETTFRSLWDRQPLHVDLYDDEALADIISLDTYPHEGRNPRYAAEWRHTKGRQSGRCLNCDRVQWERYHKPWVERFWLMFFLDELDEEEAKVVFPRRERESDYITMPDPLPYDASHPWVQQKLRDAPKFRPIVLITWMLLIGDAALEDVPDEDESEDEGEEQDDSDDGDFTG